MTHELVVNAPCCSSCGAQGGCECRIIHNSRDRRGYASWSSKWTPETREALYNREGDGAFCLPDKLAFPITDSADVRSAAQLCKYGPNPAHIKRRIIVLACRRGLSNHLPQNWKDEAMTRNTQGSTDRADLLIAPTLNFAQNARADSSFAELVPDAATQDAQAAEEDLFSGDAYGQATRPLSSAEFRAKFVDSIGAARDRFDMPPPDQRGSQLDQGSVPGSYSEDEGEVEYADRMYRGGGYDESDLYGGGLSSDPTSVEDARYSRDLEDIGADEYNEGNPLLRGATRNELVPPTLADVIRGNNIRELLTNASDGRVSYAKPHGGVTENVAREARNRMERRAAAKHLRGILNAKGRTMTSHQRHRLMDKIALLVVHCS
jgi:hypothetical protein